MKLLFSILSILFTTSLYAQNVGIGTANPVTKLDVNGSFKVSAEYVSTTALPTEAQKFTMINASLLSMPAADSIANVYDPGGPGGNYIANLNSTFRVNQNNAANSYLELTVESIDLGTGDSLIVYDGSSAASNVLYSVGNGFAGNNISVSFSSNQGFVAFKSNGDASTGAGFALLFKRQFLNASASSQPITTGSGLVFYPEKAALRSGSISADPIGNNSTALGYQTSASGAYSSAMGSFCSASGNFSTAMGINANASGSVSTAMGSATAYGDYSTAMGRSTIASGYASTSLGEVTTASGNFSTSMGFGTRAKAYILAAGRYNAFGASHSETDWVDSEYAFIIGDGTSDAARSNCFYILKNGNGWMQGTLTQASDARLKKDILKIEKALPKLKSLSGYNYHWINDEAMPELQAGLIAQEVQQQMPELVSASNEDGELAVNYSGMVPYLLEGIKEQQEEIENQNKKIKMLEDEMKAIKKLLLRKKK